MNAITLSQIEQLAEHLSISEQESLLAWLQARLGQARRASAKQTPRPLDRELHAGNVIFMADDFDMPLPDEFWLGTNP